MLYSMRWLIAPFLCLGLLVAAQVSAQELPPTPPPDPIPPAAPPSTLPDDQSAEAGDFSIPGIPSIPLPPLPLERPFGNDPGPFQEGAGTDLASELRRLAAAEARRLLYPEKDGGLAAGSPYPVDRSLESQLEALARYLAERRREAESAAPAPLWPLPAEPLPGDSPPDSPPLADPPPDGPENPPPVVPPPG